MKLRNAVASGPTRLTWLSGLSSPTRLTWLSGLLALVGWYLMVPPLVNAPFKVDTEAALASWKVYQTFDTRDECDKSLVSAQDKYKHTASAPLGTIKKGSRAFALQMTFAQCVASDDPRLKAK